MLVGGGSKLTTIAAAVIFSNRKQKKSINILKKDIAIAGSSEIKNEKIFEKIAAYSHKKSIFWPFFYLEGCKTSKKSSDLQNQEV